MLIMSSIFFFNNHIFQFENHWKQKYLLQQKFKELYIKVESEVHVQKCFLKTIFWIWNDKKNIHENYFI